MHACKYTYNTVTIRGYCVYFSSMAGHVFLQGRVTKDMKTSALSISTLSKYYRLEHYTAEKAYFFGFVH